MKILFVSSGNSKYGISPIIKNQAESLQDNIIKINYFPIKGKGLKNYFFHIFRLKRHLKENRYDLIHAHYALCGIVSHLARNKEKLVVSFMGDDLIGSINSAGKYSLYGDLIVLLNKFFIKKYDFTITKSRNLAHKLKSEDQNNIIPNGVDISVFNEKDKKECRRILDIPLDKKLILFVSNPARAEKNYKLAEDSVKLIKDNNIYLRAVHGLTKEELVLYYNAADLLLLTSLHEGSPNVIKEAMACNCPIISTDVGDVRSVIGDTRGCCLISYDPNDIVEKLKFTLTFSQKVGRTKGRERIIELGLDSKTIAKKIVALYEKVINA